MPSHEQAKNQLFESVEQGAGDTNLSVEARAWLDKFCDDWMKNPPNSGGRSIADLWDDENGGPPPNGQKLQSRFRKIGRVAAAKCDEAGKDEIGDAEVESATREVASEQDSICPWCPSQDA